MRHLNETQGSGLKVDDIHLWKPDFKHTIRKSLFRMLVENKAALDRER